MTNFLQFIRFSHTVFAMPFALGAFFVAAGGLTSWRLLGLVVVAMIFARTAAMLFNRLADWEIDKLNPRTAARHRLVSWSVAVAMCVASSLAFIAVAFFINRICFFLSPLALTIVFFYSLTKRFTAFSHFFLGLALAVAPVGAWLAVRGEWDWPPLVLAVAVIFWLAGFDVIYALQDCEVDKREGLHSLVVSLGIERAIGIALLFHALAFLFLLGFGWLAGLGWIYFTSMLLVLGAFICEHLLAKRGDVHSINLAFFHANAFVGIVFVIGILADVSVLH